MRLLPLFISHRSYIFPDNVPNAEWGTVFFITLIAFLDFRTDGNSFSLALVLLGFHSDWFFIFFVLVYLNQQPHNGEILYKMLVKNLHGVKNYLNLSCYNSFFYNWQYAMFVTSTPWTIKTCHFVFDYNSGFFWSIFILFAPVETGRNTLQTR